MLGSMVTYVTLPFQIKQLTGSYIAVGLTGAVELIPLIIFGLYGGALVDSATPPKDLGNLRRGWSLRRRRWLEATKS